MASSPAQTTQLLAASGLGTPRTAERDGRKARAWLHEELAH